MNTYYDIFEMVERLRVLRTNTLTTIAEPEPTWTIAPNYSQMESVANTNESFVVVIGSDKYIIKSSIIT